MRLAAKLMVFTPCLEHRARFQPTKTDIARLALVAKLIIANI
jgi:hypothetical protein